MKLEPLPKSFPLDRAIALSDAVFAVVMTLLVLSIDVPGDGELTAPERIFAFERLGHQVLVYFVSFWLVAMYRAQHSLLFAGLRSMDRGLLVLNLLMLLPVTLLPFVTQLMGARRDDWSVVVVFAMTNLFAASVFAALWKAVAARPELHSSPQTAALVPRILFGLPVFAAILVLGTAIAFFDVRIGVLCFVLTPVGHFLNYVWDPGGGK